MLMRGFVVDRAVKHDGTILARTSVTTKVRLSSQLKSSYADDQKMNGDSVVADRQYQHEAEKVHLR